MNAEIYQRLSASNPLQHVSFEDIPNPDRKAMMAKIGRLWCDNIGYHLLARVGVFDIGSGDRLSTHACAFGKLGNAFLPGCIRSWSHSRPTSRARLNPSAVQQNSNAVVHQASTPHKVIYSFVRKHRIIPRIMHRRITSGVVLAIISLCLIIIPEILFSGSVPNLTFDFYRVVENPNKESGDLGTVTINRRGRPYDIYTEQKASFSIPVDEINSITIEREAVRGTKDEYVYKATFSLTRSEKMRLDKFASVNDRNHFDFTFGSNRLGTVQFVGRFAGGNSMTTFLESTDSTLIKEIFAPIKNKLIWKAN